MILSWLLCRLAVLAIGVKEKEERRVREEKSLEDSSSTNTSELKSSCGGKASRTLEASSLAEAWKLRTSCCNNLAACHFQVVQLENLSALCILPFSYFQWGNHASVVQLSTVVLQADPNQVHSTQICVPSLEVSNNFDSGFLRPLTWCEGEGTVPSRCFLSWNERVCLCWERPCRCSQSWALKQVSSTNNAIVR